MIDHRPVRFYLHEPLAVQMTVFLSVTTECPILIGIFEGFSWIRCEGKGSFLNSPIMKTFGDERISAGERCLVVDLGGCTGMDSTFMGTLAGMATRLLTQDGGVLQIAESGTRNRRSLEDLGLDFLMEIDPAATDWQNQIDEIRTRLKPPQKVAVPGQVQRAMHVLEAHQVLSETNENNAKVFSDVVSLLEGELAEKQKLAESPEKS